MTMMKVPIVGGTAGSITPAAEAAADAVAAATTRPSFFEKTVTQGDGYTSGSETSSFLMIHEEDDDDKNDDDDRDGRRQHHFRSHPRQRQQRQVWRDRRSCWFRKIITVVSLLAAAAAPTATTTTTTGSIFGLLSTVFIASINRCNNDSGHSIFHQSSLDGGGDANGTTDSSAATISVAHAFSFQHNQQEHFHQYSCRRHRRHQNHHQHQRDHHRHHDRIVQSQFIVPQQHPPRCGSRSATWPSSSSSSSIYMSMSIQPDDREEVNDGNGDNSKGGSSDEERSPAHLGVGGLKEKQKQAWQQRLKEIKQYQEENNGSSYPPLGDPLRNWADNQRRDFQNDQMYSDRIELLNSINFQWSKTRRVRSKLAWDKMYNSLVEYWKENGHSDFPTPSKEDQELGRWVSTQRYLYISNASRMTPERIGRLEAIGFVWDEHEAAWLEMYNRLNEYQKKNNNSTLVPLSYEEDPELGRWVSQQRHLCKKGTLPFDRIGRLEAIGFVWYAHEAAWLEMYNRLVEYRQEEGNTDVPQGYEKDPKLGTWVLAQRQAYKKGKLSPDRIEKLEAIGFKWSVRSSSAKKSKLQDKLW